jgi:hypothetical protein
MISYVDQGIAAIAIGLIALVLLLGYRPSLTDARGGKVLAFLAFFVLPILVTWVGTSEHLQHSKSTGFCLSCHVMVPYGQSLRIDDASHLPAVHYQNNLISRDDTCSPATELHHVWRHRRSSRHEARLHLLPGHGVQPHRSTSLPEPRVPSLPTAPPFSRSFMSTSGASSPRTRPRVSNATATFTTSTPSGEAHVGGAGRWP